MSKDVISILKQVNAVITNDHFVYTSGLHGDIYINKDALYPHTQPTSAVCRLMAKLYQDKDIDVVAGPALGGIILSQWIAHHLSKIKGKQVLGVYTEKDADSNQIFTRGYDKLVKGKKVLAVEDLTTTGASVKKVINSVKKAGGKVIGVAVMVNRNPKQVTSKVIGAPFKALGILPAKAYRQKDCPLCKQNIPINTGIGHGTSHRQNRHHQIKLGPLKLTTS